MHGVDCVKGARDWRRRAMDDFGDTGLFSASALVIQGEDQVENVSSDMGTL